MAKRSAIFLVNLLQDVNIIRPLVFMASRSLGMESQLLISRKFIERDKEEIWQQELKEIGQATDSPQFIFENETEALQLLHDKTGVLVAASESNLSAHSPTHNIFRFAPSSLLKITLQHGFEGVGLLQSRDHDMAHGRNVTFAADVVCGWVDESRLTSMVPSQRSKLYVTGPPAVLQMYHSQNVALGNRSGLVCENMHSIRLNIAGDFKTDFMGIFNEFCSKLADEGKSVTLRPHPGGQYVLKNHVVLPPNVKLNNNPVYKVDLSQYAFGISAPSSIIIDMVLAGIPVAVWQDKSGVMDVGNYNGLTEISTLDEWLEFSHAAVSNPEKFIKLQQQFLENLGMPTDPSDVFNRFARLFSGAERIVVPNESMPQESKRVLFIANAFIPTLQLSFFAPLAAMIENAELVTDILTEAQMAEKFGDNFRDKKVHDWVEDRLVRFNPMMLVFCRYSGPHSDYMIAWARRKKIPVIYHIDDDLLNIPIEIGEKKYKAHNNPLRLASVRYLLDNVDIVYASTERLKERLYNLGVKATTVSGNIYCSSQVLVPVDKGPVCKVGYMGFDHEYDLNLVLPVIIQFLRRNPNAHYEQFGSIPIPAALEEFGDRVTLIPPVRNYDEFMKKFATLRWDIGICPLAPTGFNHVKANTKWVEYTSVGIAVIASRGTVYDECCAKGCGILAKTNAEWLAALEMLTSNPEKRLAQVSRAQKKLKKEYSTDQLRAQVLNVFKLSAIKASKAEKVLFVANNYIPTLQLSFMIPLAQFVDSDDIKIDVLTEDQMGKRNDEKESEISLNDWITERLENFNPTLLVFCRYNGPGVNFISDWAKQSGVPVVFHIDDDLLNIPIVIGEEKFKHHNEPKRLARVRYLLNTSDIVYCSTLPLKKQLKSIGAKSQLISGKNYCSGKVLVTAVDKPMQKFGYMASADHAHNLIMILPAIVEFLRRNPNISFELFGSIPVPTMLDEFGDRIFIRQPINNYEEFLTEFASFGWDVGICPLSNIPFNLMKANTKWVEYTSVGVAVIASRGTVYDECCSDGCGILADSQQEWLEALELLANNPGERFAQVARAQSKLIKDYSIDQLRKQVLDVFAQARCNLSGI